MPLFLSFRVATCPILKPGNPGGRESQSHKKLETRFIVPFLLDPCLVVPTSRSLNMTADLRSYGRSGFLW